MNPGRVVSETRQTFDGEGVQKGCAQLDPVHLLKSSEDLSVSRQIKGLSRSSQWPEMATGPVKSEDDPPPFSFSPTTMPTDLTDPEV